MENKTTSEPKQDFELEVLLHKYISEEGMSSWSYDSYGSYTLHFDIHAYNFVHVGMINEMKVRGYSIIGIGIYPVLNEVILQIVRN